MKDKDEKLTTALDQAIQEAVQWSEERHSNDRDRNYLYYLGKMPPGPAGRSQAASWDVFETIESALPDLMEIFLGADNIAEYTPVGEEDEEYCEQATDYINYIVQKQNPGFLLFATWIKDALLSKVGVVRAYWAQIDSVKDREYTGVNEDWLTKLLDSEDSEVISSEQYDDPTDLTARAQAQAAFNTLAPDIQAQVAAGLQQPVAQLYNLKIRETKRAGRVYIDNIQPENFIITPRAKTIDSSELVGELKTMSRSEMIERGYNKKKVAEVTGIDSVVLEETGISQEADDDTTAVRSVLLSKHTDKSTEQVLVFDGFIKLDYSGDGLAEWRHVVYGGNETLVNEAGEPDFVTMSPILVPHRLVGLALADIVAPIQEQSTAMTRQYLDSLVLANNPRTYALENQVNMDDLLNNRIGGTVRIKSLNAVGPLQTSNVAGSALEGIEFMDSRRELRTGITRYNQGLDADSLNKTATGVTKIMSAGDRRKMMMARIMAETGIKDLFRLLLKIVVENQDKAATIRLRNKWVEIDPSPWSPDMDVNVETGLGTGDKSELVAVLQFILQTQKESMAQELPLVDLKNMYNTMEAILKAAGIKGISKYFKDPDTIQQPETPPEPEKDPALALAEATVEAEKIKAEVAMKRIEADIQIKSKELEIRMVDLKIKEMDLETKRAEAVHDAEIKNRQEDRKDAELIGTALTQGQL